MRHLLLVFVGLGLQYAAAQDSTFRIALGSCSNQDKDLSILSTVASHRPNLFVYLGDNIYGDTRNMIVLRNKYRRLKGNPNYQNLKETSNVIATWDDHDYGENDAGRHYPFKKQSKRIFLRFLGDPKDSLRKQHDGIYTSFIYPVNNLLVQVILLDTRTFRDNLLPYSGALKNDTNYRYGLEYDPYDTKDSTLLGEAQWSWLQERLTQPADIRIIGSSTQFATQYNGYETWANFPHEQQRMFETIKATNAKGILFISGDVHYGELSRQDKSTSYPIYDLTCSGLTEKWRFATPNQFRIGEAVMENHFGIIDINFNQKSIALEIWDKQNQKVLLHTLPFDEIGISERDK